MYIHQSYKDRQLARFYDLEYGHYTDDLSFYVQHAQAMDPEKALPVLELGCGTGRIAIPLAEAGHRVVGIDTSEGMLETCAKRAQSRGVREKLSLVRADMQNLKGLPDTIFNMAFCALNTFAYLATTTDQLAMLNAVRPLLVQHGILLLDLTSPLRHLLPPSDGETLYEGSFKDPETGAILHKFVAGHAHPATQTHDIRVFYELEERDGTSQRITQPLTFRWTSRYEMELLLQTAGFKLEKVYGNYDLDDYDDNSERMIFVART